MRKQVIMSASSAELSSKPRNFSMSVSSKRHLLVKSISITTFPRWFYGVGSPLPLFSTPFSIGASGEQKLLKDKISVWHLPLRQPMHWEGRCDTHLNRGRKKSPGKHFPNSPCMTCNTIFSISESPACTCGISFIFILKIYIFKNS
jgi:hypothetical protein